MKKLFNRKYLIGLIVFLFLGFFVLVLTDPQTVSADDGGGGFNWLSVRDRLFIILAWPLFAFASFLGKICLYLIAWLIQVAVWSEFVSVPAVETGWVVIRDLCNMFFIVILLVIAFATILRIESYNIKQLLPKVIIMAVLINFSKTICGWMVELGQIVMLQFVNAFAGSGSETGGGTIVDLLGIQYVMSAIRAEAQAEPGSLGLEIVSIAILAIVVTLVAGVVILSMIGVLLMRVIMIWVYIVLSPLAFLLYAFPHGKSYASRWLSSFSKQIIVGPVLAFFIWLALYTARGSAERLGHGKMDDQGLEDGVISGFLAPDVFLTYILTLAFFIGGLVIAQQIGEVSGKAAGMGLSSIQKGKALAGRGAWKGGKWTAKTTGKTTGKLGLVAGSGIDRTIGRGLDRITRGDQFKDGLVTPMVKKAINFPSEVRAKFDERVKKRSDYKEAQNEAMKNEYEGYGGAIYTTDDQGREYSYNEKTGKYERKDEDGKLQTFKDKHGQDVKRGSPTFGTPFHDATLDVYGSGSRAAVNNAQAERVEEARKGMDVEGRDMGVGRLEKTMDNAENTDERIAAALQIATKGGFKTREQYEKAKKLVSSNSILSDKLEKETDKNQASISNDLSTEDGRNSFRKKLDKGDLDSTKLDSNFYEDNDGKLVELLRDYHGKEFKRIAESIYKKGTKKVQENFDKALLKERDKHHDSQGDVTKDWKKIASTHSNLTGEADRSFQDKDGKLQKEAFKSHLKEGKAADLNKIKRENLDNIISDNSWNENEMAQALSFGKAKSMYREGSNPETSRAVRDLRKKYVEKKFQEDKDWYDEQSEEYKKENKFKSEFETEKKKFESDHELSTD